MLMSRCEQSPVSAEYANVGSFVLGLCIIDSTVASRTTLWRLDLELADDLKVGRCVELMSTSHMPADMLKTTNKSSPVGRKASHCTIHLQHIREPA